MSGFLELPLTEMQKIVDGSGWELEIWNSISEMLNLRCFEMPSVLCEVKLRPELPSFGLRDELSSVVPHWCGGGGLMSFPGRAAD